MEIQQPKGLRICSDLHLEFYKNQTTQDKLELLIPHRTKDKDCVLILAGDISSNWKELDEVYNLVCPRFHTVFSVPGNHEYYGNDMIEWGDHVDRVNSEHSNLRVAAQDGIARLIFDSFIILGTTLWADGGKGNPLAENSIGRLPDFRYIKDSQTPWTVKDMQALNALQAKWLEAELVSATGFKPTAVITHHLPSYHLCDKRYSPSVYDGLFASNQDKLFVSTEFYKAPKLWVFGHTHTHVDRKLGETWTIANPSGYPNESETFYNTDCFIDLEEIL